MRQTAVWKRAWQKTSEWWWSESRRDLTVAFLSLRQGLSVALTGLRLTDIPLLLPPECRLECATAPALSVFLRWSLWICGFSLHRLFILDFSFSFFVLSFLLSFGVLWFLWELKEARYFSFCWQRCYVYTDHVLGFEKGSKATDKSDTEVLFLSNKWVFILELVYTLSYM